MCDLFLDERFVIKKNMDCKASKEEVEEIVKVTIDK